LRHSVWITDHSEAAGDHASGLLVVCAKPQTGYSLFARFCRSAVERLPGPRPKPSNPPEASGYISCAKPTSVFPDHPATAEDRCTPGPDTRGMALGTPTRHSRNPPPQRRSPAGRADGVNDRRPIRVVWPVAAPRPRTCGVSNPARVGLRIRQGCQIGTRPGRRMGECGRRWILVLSQTDLAGFSVLRWEEHSNTEVLSFVLDTRGFKRVPPQPTTVNQRGLDFRREKTWLLR
jgi:hypothetical protein